MKRLMSDEELRDKLEDAYEAGMAFGQDILLNRYRGRGPANFEDWYEEVYGGPDCE